jgi:hypothetical protein
MTDPRKQLSADRLCETADAVVHAIREMIDDAGSKGGSVRHVPYPPSLMGTAAQPACLARFTPFEVEESTAFLIRLGLLETHWAKAG